MSRTPLIHGPRPDLEIPTDGKSVFPAPIPVTGEFRGTAELILSNPMSDPNPPPSLSIPNPLLSFTHFSPFLSTSTPNPNPSSTYDVDVSFQVKRKRTGVRRKAPLDSSLQASPPPHPPLPPQTFPQIAYSINNSLNKPNPVPDISEEIIVINKEATNEALTALTLGFPADSITDEEIEAGVISSIGGIEQVNYILIRNHILSRWRENVSNWLTKEFLSSVLPPHCEVLLNSAYNFLVSHGYVNFGVAPAIKEKIPAEPTKQTVVIVGAGLAGLAAARQLMRFGFKVVILEGRKRSGGRVYTKKMEGADKFAAADLGGSVLTSTLGNPLGIIGKQLGSSFHKVRDKCPLYRPDGKPVDPDVDIKLENAFNRVLEKMSRLRKSMGEVAMDISLGAALETFRQVYGDAVTDEEMNLFNWHLANLEYANAGLLSKLSLAFWDQDDPYDMGGDHCFLPGGNGRFIQALAENVPILYEKTVHTIRYGADGVQVIAGGQVYEGDMALCTVSLGVLKNGSIKFSPELPQRKLDGIRRLGFGLLNKVAMLFPYVFWSTDVDTFGHLSEDPSRRGEFFLFYSYATVAGGPLLIALVAGEAAHNFESMPPMDAVSKILQILRGKFKEDQKSSSCNHSGRNLSSIRSFYPSRNLLLFLHKPASVYGLYGSSPGRRQFFSPLFLQAATSSQATGSAQATAPLPATAACQIATAYSTRRDIYKPQGIDVPDPLQSVCTRWGTDSFSLGSYSHVAVGASGDDYDILAESVGDGRLFFAGEATTRRYPATMHGAFLSGLREAANITRHANARALNIEVERSISKNTRSCAALLEDLFREPDLEFGSFSVIFGGKTCDPKPAAILRVALGSLKKSGCDGIRADQQHLNKLLFQQLQSHYNQQQQQQLHVYTLLSQQQALELREVRGGDEMRLHYLCEKLGVKLMNRKGLGSTADSVIASIKAERGNPRSLEASRLTKE
ncbi:hypothetical protein KSP40_PGU021582 [Platanthera guangdongensis]|uniref:SWIRM domain-containing protein n=1 Tax=Platanthera guangdongensis TaxID=2320717 RepID=A0ABR2M1I9_9ASPA